VRRTIRIAWISAVAGRTDGGEACMGG